MPSGTRCPACALTDGTAPLPGVVEAFCARVRGVLGG